MLWLPFTPQSKPTESLRLGLEPEKAGSIRAMKGERRGPRNTGEMTQAQNKRINAGTGACYSSW